MSRTGWLLAAAACAGTLTLGACGAREPAPQQFSISRADTLISSESELLGSPLDLAVDERGRIFVLDYMFMRVAALARPGVRPVFVGREGRGPGEFRGPAALAVAHDTLRVVDLENARLQVLTADGRFVRSYPLPGLVMNGEVSLSASGRAGFSTLGLHVQSLAVLLDPEGATERTIGALQAPPVRLWDFAEFKEEALAGRVPSALRNHALPVLGDDGVVWLVLLAGPTVQRYAPDGRLVWSREIRSPELDAIRSFYFAQNRADKRPFVFFPLRYVRDAAAVGGELWLLLNGGDEDSPAILVLGANGAVRARISVPVLAGARQFAVDVARKKVYLALANASVVAVDLPPAAFTPTPGPG